MESQTQTTSTTTPTTAENVPVAPVVDGEPVVEAPTEQAVVADTPPSPPAEEGHGLTPAVGVVAVLLVGLLVVAVRKVLSK
jgi:hypothetical protein